MLLAEFFARLRAGSKIPAKTAITAITTNNSTKVKADSSRGGSKGSLPGRGMCKSVPLVGVRCPD
jgi:hypothetical protein